MSGLKLAGGNDIAMKSDRDEVLDLLKRQVAKIESGEINPNRALIMLTEHDVDSFYQNLTYHGRVTEILGLLVIVQQSLLQETGVTE
jgi:hypothetical protein